jgi:16S rRNA C967 or C1407 C5-methylase (RsmB/RsmF family)/NOL1/NOP2/fmu family ribosome biogenesis protein
MLPDQFIKRIKTQGYIDSDLLIRALQEPSHVSIRTNRLKWDKFPLDSEKIPWCQSGWLLHKRPSFTLDPLFQAGCYYPQESSGMFLEEIFRQIIEVRQGLRVLDLCAAPGGKSTHISSLIGTNGVLIANEVIKTRAKILAENITRWGEGNTIVTSSDPSEFKEFKGYFDVMLVDAPCSGEGMFRDPIAVKEWSVSNTVLCAERQKRILLDAWPSLKENGILIYSTCTFNPSENEEQVKWLVENRKAESVRLDTSSFTGITEISYDGITGYGFYPGKVSGDGLFIALVRKLDQEAVTGRRKSKKRMQPDQKVNRSAIKEWLKHEPAGVLSESDSLYSLPFGIEEYALVSDHLEIIKKGTEVFTVKNNNFIPSNELVFSVNISADILPSKELTQSQAIKFLRKEQINNIEMDEGWVIMKYMGVNLGLVKNIGTRINNYFPTGWRIKMFPDEEKLRSIISWT